MRDYSTTEQIYANNNNTKSFQFAVPLIYWHKSAITNGMQMGPKVDVSISVNRCG